MYSFQYYAPVALFVGRGCVAENAAVFPGRGERAFVLTSRFSEGCRNIALDDVCRVLADRGAVYSVWDAVEENPSVESIRRVSDAIIAFAPDCIIAIGGGSALDTAKAANVLINYPPEADAYAVFYGGRQDRPGDRSRGKLPLIGIPTTAGSGSEVAGYAVLTRNDLHTKQRIDQFSFFRDAFLDARYIESSPVWLLEAGALDALAHGIESALNVDSSCTSRMLTDLGFSLFCTYRDRLLAQQLHGSDFDNMLLAASVQGMAVVQASTTLPHGMGYPLTHEKGIVHGFASCVCLAEYLKSFRRPENIRTVNDVLKKTGFSDPDALGDYLGRIISRSNAPCVSRAEALAWSEAFSHNEGRMRRTPERPDLADIQRIYIRSLERCGLIQE